MIIEQKLNHGGPSDLFVRPAAGGQAINLTADWDLEPGSDPVVAGQPLHLLRRGDRR